MTNPWVKRLSSFNIDSPILVDASVTFYFDDTLNYGLWLSSDHKRLTLGKKPSDGFPLGPGDRGPEGPQGPDIGSGINGNFTSSDGKVVTVVNGIVTKIN